MHVACFRLASLLARNTLFISMHTGILPDEIDEIMDVEKDGGEYDLEFHAKVMQARAVVTEVSEFQAIKRMRLSGESEEPRPHQGTATEPAPAVLPSEEVSGVPATPQFSPAQAEAANRVQLFADKRSHVEEVARSRAAKTRKTPGKCKQVRVGSSSGRPPDILFNNINDWSRKAAAFFLQRRPRVALFVEHYLAAGSLPREKELWERHGHRLFMEPAQTTGNGKGTTGRHWFHV